MEQSGHEVIDAPNGKLGFKLFKENSLDLVITDIVMPEMDGLETITEIRKIDRNIKIIAISGGGIVKGFDYLLVAERLGADRTLKKPFDWSELLCVVKELIGSNSQEEGCINY